VNNLLLADAYATAGLQCYIPDYLNGDPVPQDMKTNPEVAKSFSMPAWRARHTSLQTRPALDACIQYLKEEKKVKKIYAIGYCFGARYVMDLILEGADGKGNDSILSKAAFAHPSQLRVPEDFERLLEIPPSRRIPLLFLTCENDPQFPKEAQSKADEMLEKLNVTTEGNEGNKKMMYKRVYYEGNDHGFAVRGDVSLEHVKKAKEDAFKQAVEWFKCGY
jgi:dienelactone hydrolase